MKRILDVIWGLAEGLLLGVGISIGTVLVLFIIGQLAVKDGNSAIYISDFGKYILLISNIFIASGTAVMVILYHKSVFPVIGAVCAWKIVWLGLEYLDVTLDGSEIVTGGRIGPEGGVIFTGAILTVILLYGKLLWEKKCKG